jgi:hypothetical protein
MNRVLSILTLKHLLLDFKTTQLYKILELYLITSKEEIEDLWKICLEKFGRFREQNSSEGIN